MKLINSEVVVDGKVTKPAEYEMDVVQKMRITAPIVDQQIARLTAELAKWTAIKAEMNPVVVEEQTV